MVQIKLEDIPETWDVIKRKNPIHPTCSRGKFGSALYCNNKYHCYSVNHSKPRYELMPYRATGFGFGERSMKYIPLSHVEDRTIPKPAKLPCKGAGMKRIYDANMQALQCTEADVECGAPRKTLQSFREERELKRLEAAGYERYRVHLINRLLRDHREMLSG